MLEMFPSPFLGCLKSISITLWIFGILFPLVLGLSLWGGLVTDSLYLLLVCLLFFFLLDSVWVGCLCLGVCPFLIVIQFVVELLFITVPVNFFN
jgi:hypothetical protein